MRENWWLRHMQNTNFYDIFFMLVIADGFRRLFLQFLPWFHYLIFDKLIGIDLVQIWIALVPKGTGSVPQSMEKRNWSRSKRNWEIPISDQNRSAFSHLHYLCFHRLMLHLLKSQTILDNQHTDETSFYLDNPVGARWLKDHDNLIFFLEKRKKNWSVGCH